MPPTATTCAASWCARRARLPWPRRAAPRSTSNWRAAAPIPPIGARASPMPIACRRRPGSERSPAAPVSARAPGTAMRPRRSPRQVCNRWQRTALSRSAWSRSQLCTSRHRVVTGRRVPAIEFLLQDRGFAITIVSLRETAARAVIAQGGFRVALLDVRSVSMSFGAIRALTELSFTVDAGEVVGLMGDNGAGKSTMVKIIAGNFPPTDGEIAVDGEICHFHKPGEARARGIEVVYQDLALADNLTAAQNVFLGRELKKGIWPFRILDKRAMLERADALFQELKSETRPRDLVRKMSGGQRQAVAIARTRLTKAKLILMDEPTAAISVRQVAEVLGLIRRLKAQGVSVVLISHRMPDVFDVADRIIVLRRGSKVADKQTVQTSPEEITGLITGAIRAA